MALEPHVLVEDLFGCAICPMPRSHPVHIIQTAEAEEVYVHGREEPIHSFEIEPPSLPYDGSSGHSGSETSRERAQERDREGVTNRIQKRLLACLDGAAEVGITIAEVRVAFPEEHHGSLSGALSNLHKDGRIERLTERRSRCEVYVLPEHVNSRETVAQGRRRTSRLTADDTDLLTRAARRVDSDLPISIRDTADLIALVRRLDGAPHQKGTTDD